MKPHGHSPKARHNARDARLRLEHAAKLEAKHARREERWREHRPAPRTDHVELETADFALRLFGLVRSDPKMLSRFEPDELAGLLVALPPEDARYVVGEASRVLGPMEIAELEAAIASMASGPS